MNYRLTDSSFSSPVEVLEGSMYVVVGDNRSNSLYSRSFVSFSERRILGRVLFGGLESELRGDRFRVAKLPNP